MAVVKRGAWLLNEDRHVRCQFNLKGHLIKPTVSHNPSHHSAKSRRAALNFSSEKLFPSNSADVFPDKQASLYHKKKKLSNYKLKKKKKKKDEIEPRSLSASERNHTAT